MNVILCRSLSAIVCLALLTAASKAGAQQAELNAGQTLFTPSGKGASAQTDVNFSGTTKWFSAPPPATYNEADASYVSPAPGAGTAGTFSITPFSCTSGVVWQVTGTPSKLYAYNVNTGLQTLIASLTQDVNAIGYNETDGTIWGADLDNTSDLVRIDGAGVVTTFTIANLPNNYYDVGVELPGGFLLITGDDITSYYVIDINPSDANYLKLVNPANTSVAQSGTYGKTMGAVLNCNDIAYDPVTGLLYGLGNPGTTDAYKLMSLNSTTGAVGVSTSKVTGSTIQSETTGYGSAYFDPAGILYVFADDQGYFYSVNVSTFTAALLSKSTAAQNNDGGNCAGAFLSYTVSGTVYDDANGLNDNTVNGTGTYAGGTLNAILYDNTAGIVASVTSVASNGTFSMPATPGDSYTVYISTASPTVGSTSTPTVTLPSGWVSTGEYFGSGTGSDGTPNGVLSIGAVNAATSNVNFGIDQKPTGTNTTAASQPNPNGGGAATVPSTVFNGTDAEDGTYTSNLTGRTVTLNAATGGTLYYNGVAVTSSTTISSFNPAKVSLDPTATGATSPTFTYDVEDNASVFSSNITITVPFTTPTRAISGTIWDDTNGDAIKGTGESYTNASGQVYVNLVSSAGAVIQSVLADATTGAYSLGGQNNTAYKIIITNTSEATGATLTTASLPTGWVATGVNISGTASTINQTGIISVATGTTALTNQNFGIEQLPSANNVSGAYTNPGGTNKVVAPTLTGTDPEDGTYNGTSGTNEVIINTLPASGTLYYNGTAVTAGQTISNYSPTLLTYNPPTGAGTYTFTYSEVDAAGRSSSAAATATMTFTDLTLGGIVYDDANGGSINGTATNTIGSNTMHANLVSTATGKVLASTAVASGGTYSFGTANGIQQNTSFEIIVTNSAGTTGQTPPSTSLTNAVNTAEGTSSTGDGTPDGTTTVSVATTSVSSVNFGIDQLPSAYAFYYQISPVPTRGETEPITSSYRNMVPLSFSDPEDGTPTSGFSVVITSLPEMNGNVLSYNGTAITSANIPFNISSYTPAELMVTFNQDNPSGFFFTYEVVDLAGEPSPAVDYVVTWGTTLLALQMSGFTAQQQGSYAALNWYTETETNVDHFEIDRSADGINWVNIASVLSSGNSNTRQGYSYIDKAPLNGKNYYRIEQVNTDGSADYSAVKLVSIDEAWSVSLYPNPALANGVIKVQSNELLAGVKVVSMNGQPIFQKELSDITATLDMNKAAQGIYLVQVTNNKGEVRNLKLIIAQ